MRWALGLLLTFGAILLYLFSTACRLQAQAACAAIPSFLR
jgi:hypothetical protein